jgi:hypothetical protein
MLLLTSIIKNNIIMKKLFIALTLTVFVTGFSFAQQTNAPDGSNNIYKNLYGTVQGSSRGAMDAVVYVDYAIENDFVLAGLANLGYTVYVATSWADFNAKLVSGNYGLAVGFNQNSGNGISGQAVQTFIAAGGCIIYTDWIEDNGIAGIFEANYNSNDNLSPMTITDAGLAGGVTNPVALSNPGWGIWSMGMTAIGGGQVLATFPGGHAAVVLGNGGKSVILGYLSDTPLFADRQQLFENVVNTTVCGGGPEVPVSDWAIYLGIFLILSFVVVRYVKAS